MATVAAAPEGPRNHGYHRKSTLSSGRQQLLRLMQNINFGRLENLRIYLGEPLAEPVPTIIREVKFGGENGPRPESGQRDLAIKSQVVELFQFLDHEQNCVIEVLEIKHGLPFRMLVRGSAA